MTRTALALSLALSLAACGGSSAGGGGGETGGGGTGGGEVSYAGPIASTDATHGETRFRAACISCHEGGPPASAVGWSPEQMRRQIREGRGEMPPITSAHLSDADLEALLAYLVTTGTVADSGAAPAESGGATP